MLNYKPVIWYVKYCQKKYKKYISPQKIRHYLALEEVSFKYSKNLHRTFKEKCYKKKDAIFVIETYLI